jgi:transposase-like protein
VDASAEETVLTDSMGRRTGPRRQHSLEEKLKIVQETHVVGASVSRVARRHNVNPNQVFAWRQLYRQGLLKPGGSEGGASMLPVKVNTPTVLPTERVRRRTAREAIVAERPSADIEIKLSNGHCIVVSGHVDLTALARVIDLLVRR